MNTAWGELKTDYVAKMEGMCSKCHLSCQDKNDVYCFYDNICAADYDVKHDYTYGRLQDAIALLRGLPSELLKDYLSEKRRTPAELKAVILDELQIRNETETIMRL